MNSRISEGVFREALSKKPITLDFDQLQLYHCPSLVLSYEHLKSSVVDCQDCYLGKNDMVFVRDHLPSLYFVNNDSPYVFVGRNPNSQDYNNMELLSHTHPIGQVFSKYLNILGLSKKEIYETNTAFCPSIDENYMKDEAYVACAKYKKAEFKRLTNPKFVFLLGDNAVKQFISPVYSVIKLQGTKLLVKDFMFENQYSYVFIVLHPGYLVNNRMDTWIAEETLHHINETYLVPYHEFLESSPTLEEQKKWQIPT